MAAFVGGVCSTVRQDILITNINLPIVPLVPSTGFLGRMLVENEVCSDLVLGLTCATVLHPEVTG